jgi:hypothetical protein
MSSIQETKSAFCSGGMYLQSFKFGFNGVFKTSRILVSGNWMPTTFLECASYNLSVRLLYPAGGWPHAIAIIFASTSPVTFAGTGGVSRFFLVSTRSIAPCAYCLLTVYTNFVSQ